ncbi:hypothetical protein [Thiolapillus sp.]|uniref:hypothetical protein n=1 Tax=Thiolapillus sp. TaxID=2017437 RepID=UPI0025FA830A|nr:hypothetical protein [Thiolapillus sp.]
MTEKRTTMEIHMAVKTAGIKAVDLLVEAGGLSRGQVKKAMKNGAAWLERRGHVQRLRRADRRLLRVTSCICTTTPISSSRCRPRPN